MGSYVPLCQVTVTNAYFSSRAWAGLEFVANAATNKLLNAAGLVVKRTVTGIQIIRDTEKDPVLQSFADDGEGRLRFCFSVFVKDRSFENYTSVPKNDVTKLLLFDSLTASNQVTQETFRMSRGECVSDEDLIDFSDGVGKGYLDAADQSVKPNFVVAISINFPASAGLPLPGYSVDFAARQSYWQYFFLGQMNRANIYIVDLDNAVEFEACGNSTVFGNSAASVFRSKSTLPVLERSPYRFQLKESGYGNGRVLIKRLPVASDRLGLESVGGQTVLVANNYVNY